MLQDMCRIRHRFFTYGSGMDIENICVGLPFCLPLPYDLNKHGTYKNR